MKNNFWLLLICMLSLPCLWAQSLEDLANSNEETHYATASFKGTKVLNTHSLETLGAGVLQVNFQHRFGTLENGFYDFFGLDQASIRFGFDYAITNRLIVGIGRSSLQKAYDGYVKYKLLRQSDGAINMPVSLTILATTAVNTLRTRVWFPANAPMNELYRYYYTYQAIIGRKFSPVFSAQIMPTLVHRNFTDSRADANTIYSIGAAFRYKLTKRMGWVMEGYYTPAHQLSARYVPLIVGAGVEIETGGHVYHLLFTNTNGLIEHQIIGATTSKITDGIYAIRFGFNLSRVFTIVNY